MNRIDDKLLKEVSEKGEYIKNKLAGKPGISSVSGVGLMLGVAVAADAKKVVSSCLNKGVLFLTAKDKVRLLPALNIPYELLDKAIDALLEAVKEEL